MSRLPLLSALALFALPTVTMAQTAPAGSAVVGQPGVRQTPAAGGQGIAPMARIESRLQNRVQSRIANRLDGGYAAVTATSALKAASENVKRPARR